MRRDRLQVERRKLSFAEKEQGGNHAHPQRDKYRNNSFDPSPPPPIGFQIPHYILAVGSLVQRKLDALRPRPN
jgi:hypothetical protein